jgi:hypothetical protein
VKLGALAVSAVVAAASLLALEKPAAAQGQVDIDWRQHDRADHFDRTKLEFPSFVFDLRFGGYAPRIDSDPNLHGKTPYKDVFGGGPRFLIGFEIDWLALRIPYIGAVGPGASFGWVGSSTLAKIDLDKNPATGNCKGTLDGCYSAESTTLSLFPMYVVAVLRIDDPMVRFGIPIVPYLKVGLDGTIWTAGTASGKTYVDPSTKSVVSSSGWSWGEHLAIGAALSLNWLDRDAVNRSREASGVRDFYLYGELADYDAGIIGPSRQLRVGANAWVVGISLDF